MPQTRPGCKAELFTAVLVWEAEKVEQPGMLNAMPMILLSRDDVAKFIMVTPRKGEPVHTFLDRLDIGDVMTLRKHLISLPGNADEMIIQAVLHSNN